MEATHLSTKQEIKSDEKLLYVTLVVLAAIIILAILLLISRLSGG